MCLYPREIQNPRFKPNKKNQGIIPPLRDNRLEKINVPCGKCIECHKARGNQWRTRLLHEIKDDPKAVMVTLTFNTEHLKALTTTAMENGSTWGYSLDNELARLSVRRFYDRWRKSYGEIVKYWLITELGKGEHEHLHLHGLIWTDKPGRIEKTWKYGFIHIGRWIGQRTINYMMKYFLKHDDRHPNYKPRVFATKGIGKGYLTSELATFNRFNGANTKEFYITEKGTKASLPKYWRDKLYTPEQKEDLRLQKLDSQIQYVGGERFNMTINQDEYFIRLGAATQKNSRLGYGPYKEQYKHKHHENNRRGEIQKKRLENLKTST